VECRIETVPASKGECRSTEYNKGLNNERYCCSQMKISAFNLSLYDAAVLDLDGVVTQTARLHAHAWKSTFDEFLVSRDNSRPFDIDADYRQFVDGKSRLDGVRSFLTSRDITIPSGEPDDVAEADTVYGLGKRKNLLFQDLLSSDGAIVFPGSIHFIHALKSAGLAVAVASSSRNCKTILHATGIENLFDARVDGVDIDQLKLAGKPAPDMFIEACRRLNCPPQRCIGIEDAIVGVQALQAAGFGLVIGVDRVNHAAILNEMGADLVVNDLGDLLSSDTGAERDEQRSTQQPPSALEHTADILADRQRELLVFVDYDGTLTPIVDHPDKAILSDSMRGTLSRLAGLCRVAVLSGRDLKDVQNKVAIPQLWYAGSHGFDIEGPDGAHHEHEEGARFLPLLDKMQQLLNTRLGSIPGCLIERKHFSLAVHYRKVSDQDLPEVQAAVEELHQSESGLRLSPGKKIFEFQPDIAWHKGYALRWLIEQWGLDRQQFKPLYLGDDVTDEDGFREVAGDGVGILVAQQLQTTLASYQLADTEAVEVFLQQLCAHLEEARDE